MSKIFSRMRPLISHEAISGSLLGLAALGALIIRNSPLSSLYMQQLNATLFSFSWLGVSHNICVTHIVNEVLMVGFFALVTIEIKREFFVGVFQDLRYALLPCMAALGGVLVPAFIYLSLNWHNPVFSTGWAIPTATDIAFSLGILSLIGSRVPISLRIFLTTLAIVDDLFAVFIIALAYSSALQWAWIGASVLLSGILYTLNKHNVQVLSPYLVVGLLLWWVILESGIHVTIAGVLWAASLPLQSSHGDKKIALLYRIEHYLRPTVNYFILPAFAFVNAGVPLSGMSLHSMSHPVFLGVFIGLTLGKPLGILLGSGLALITGMTSLPRDMNWHHLASASCLGGIGFTMSLLIGALNFPEGYLLVLVRQAILLGSLCSVITALLLFPSTSARLFVNRC